MLRASMLLGLTISLLGIADSHAQFYGKERFEVASADQFLAAVGSDRTIVITPPVLTLSGIADKKHPNIRRDGEAITIIGVKNLRVQSGQAGPSEIVALSDGFVLAFEKCQNFELRNLTFRHERPDGKCTSAVLGFVSCTNTLVRACQLTGCGTEGLTLSRVDRFQGRDLTIRNCTMGILSVQHSRNLIFRESRFERNGKLYGIDIQKSYGIELNNCIFADNRIDGDLIAATDSGKITVSAGELTGNRYRRLRNDETAIRISDLKGLGQKQ